MSKPRKSRVWQPKELREQLLILFCTLRSNGLRINARYCPKEGHCEELDSLLKKGKLIRTREVFYNRTTYTVVRAVDDEGNLLPAWGDTLSRVRCPCCGNVVHFNSKAYHAEDCPARF